MTQTGFTLGDWRVEPQGNRLSGADGDVELEPRVMDLLVLFARNPGVVLSKDRIATALWGDVHVNDDALTRTVFKLRRALGDDARSPRYIGTVAKRGYRLLVPVEGPAPASDAADDAALQGASQAPALPTPRPGLPLPALAGLVGVVIIALAGLMWALARPVPAPSAPPGDSELARQLDRADAFYHQFTRADNAAAQRLYEGVLARDPDNAAALAGLSNVVTQTVIRYSPEPAEDTPRSLLGAALESGWVDRPDSRAALERAVALARQATEADPGHARAWRALGLALSAQRAFDAARQAYERALVIAPDDWGALINLADLNGLAGNDAAAIAYLEQAFEAMSRRYDRETAAIRPWQSDVGLSIAERYLAAGEAQQAELWYRRVLALDPLNPDAVRGLAARLESAGDPAGARSLCADLAAATGRGCETDE